jgi:hypothetical protein
MVGYLSLEKIVDKVSKEDFKIAVMNIDNAYKIGLEEEDIQEYVNFITEKYNNIKEINGEFNSYIAEKELFKDSINDEETIIESAKKYTAKEELKRCGMKNESHINELAEILVNFQLCMS